MIIGPCIVVTGGPRPAVLDGAGVRVIGSHIAQVGPAGSLAAAHPDDTLWPARGRVLMPGLVNAHDHLRNLAPCNVFCSGNEYVLHPFSIQNNDSNQNKKPPRRTGAACLDFVFASELAELGEPREQRMERHQIRVHRRPGRDGKVRDVEPGLLDLVKTMSPGAQGLFNEIQKGKKEFAERNKKG